MRLRVGGGVALGEGSLEGDKLWEVPGQSSPGKQEVTEAGGCPLLQGPRLAWGWSSTMLG